MTDALLGSTADAAVVKLRASGAAAADPANAAQTALYVQLLGAMARAVGYRFGKHVAAAMPLVATLCRDASDEGSEQLREHCLQARPGNICWRRHPFGEVLGYTMRTTLT